MKQNLTPPGKDSLPLAEPTRSGLIDVADRSTADSRAAFELKFLIDGERAAAVEQWAAQHLSRDSYGDPTLGGAYRTTSLYCDTPQLDVYRGAPWYRRRKFRIRRYGAAESIFLERKVRSGDRVAKRRTQVAAEQLSMLSSLETESLWPGYWFVRRLAQRRLSPTCQIAYERTAYVDSNPGESLRLTLDREIRGSLTDRWCLVPAADGVRLLSGQVILELKFRCALPARFKRLVAELSLVPSGVSKYRLCHDACQSKPARTEAAGA